MTETKATVDYNPEGTKRYPFTAVCPVCETETMGWVSDSDEVNVEEKCEHFLSGELCEDGNLEDDILTVFWDDDFDHWFMELLALVEGNNLTDLTNYELPKKALRGWFNENITPYSAAYRIATNGI